MIKSIEMEEYQKKIDLLEKQNRVLGAEAKQVKRKRRRGQSE